MIKLVSYFEENCTDGYYHHHFGYIPAFKEEICYYDADEVITEFKRMIQPGFEKNVPLSKNEDFILLCFYLYNEGYVIKEFPNFLSRPDSKCALYDFGYEQIRLYLREKYNYVTSVPWEARRQLIDKLTFEKNEYNVDADIDQLMQNISTRSASFLEMSVDEKLKEICNGIEYLLKKNGKYFELDYTDCLDILSDDYITQYKTKLNCFRHASKESLLERANYSDFQKQLLVRYGIFILETIKSKLDSMED